MPAKRPSSSARGYGTGTDTDGNKRSWPRERAAYLKDHPLCSHNGCSEPATVVDHITPHRNDPALLWDRDNWQALCKHHHDAKTASEDGGFGRSNEAKERARAAAAEESAVRRNAPAYRRTLDRPKNSAAILQLVLAGTTDHAIAQQFNVHHSSIRAWRHRHIAEIQAVTQAAIDQAAEAAAYDKAMRLDKLSWLASQIEGIFDEHGFMWEEPFGELRTVLRPPNGLISQYRETLHDIAVERGEIDKPGDGKRGGPMREVIVREYL